ncbi:MAG: LysR family transcriptional regulator, partial [Proteobacteria bacterium]|nr:LysR family transcriptional regulator [Pseudomonadota bacterium]
VGGSVDMEILMDYNKLKTFVIVAENGTLTKAADVMRRSQSAITQQIQLLEDELGLRLFERKGGRVYLSGDGESIFRLVQGSLVQIDDGIESLKDSLKDVKGHIKLGALQDGGTEFNYGKAIAKFCRSHPKVTFSVHAGTYDTLEAGLIKNELDLAFSVVFTKPEMFIQTPVIMSWHSPYTSKSYAVAHGPIDTFRKVIECDLIDISEEMLGLTTFINKNAKTLLATIKHRRPAVVAPNLEVVKEIVLAGFGVAMIPDHLAARDVKAGRLIKLLPNAKSTYGRLDIAYRTNRSIRLCERLFIASVAERPPVKG